MNRRLRFGFSAVCASNVPLKWELASAMSRPSHVIENGERQVEMGSTSDSPVPRGDSPHGMTSEPAISKGATTLRGSGWLVARQHGPVARATLLSTESFRLSGFI